MNEPQSLDSDGDLMDQKIPKLLVENGVEEGQRNVWNTERQTSMKGNDFSAAGSK